MTKLQVRNLWKCFAVSNAFYCLFISQALNYGALAVKNFRPDHGRCRAIGIHCTPRGNHLYSTPEVTEEHEIGKQLKHHSACEALGRKKSSCALFYFILFFPNHIQASSYFLFILPSSPNLVQRSLNTHSMAFSAIPSWSQLLVHPVYGSLTVQWNAGIRRNRQQRYNLTTEAACKMLKVSR